MNKTSSNIHDRNGSKEKGILFLNFNTILALNSILFILLASDQFSLGTCRLAHLSY